MKISINHGEKQTGFIRKTTYYTTTVQVLFTEEEKHVINRNKLKNHIVAERPVRAGVNPREGERHPDIWNLEVYHLLDGKADTYEFLTPAECKEYQERIMAGLKGIKAFVLQHSEAAQDTSIEL